MLGFTRDEALDRLNVGYLWHAIWVFAYMFFVIGGRLIVSVYRIDVSRGKMSVGGQPFSAPSPSSP